MLKKVLTIIFCITSYFVLAQKKEYFLNDDFNFITETEFIKEHDNPLDYNLRLKLDTCFYNVKVSRYKKGKISLQLLDSIKTDLSSLSKEELKPEDILVINYYPGNTPCSSYGYMINFKNKHDTYFNEIEKIKNLKQFFIYKTPDNLKDFGSKIDWLRDKNRLIEKIFFPIAYPCGGYVIIDSNGNYICQRGEYCYSPSFIKRLKEFIENKP
ncbi:hypothetical protein [Flavobacterium dankookense]|uniref:Uncharacterized protein n=1 Tax=Flavobacterium dankookense TaxID=706186 RepID=A0A4R6Q7W4_9FLAO|nr:hypothetical protein [Flavobacterium dankookense]TDP58331.1 hypothetical protein BC748_2370 [Flavobacterium dankookense]